jgi:hypothetical protein
LSFVYIPTYVTNLWPSRGLPYFLGTTNINRKHLPKLARKYPMAIQYTKMPQIYQMAMKCTIFLHPIRIKIAVLGIQINHLATLTLNSQLLLQHSRIVSSFTFFYIVRSSDVIFVCKPKWLLISVTRLVEFTPAGWLIVYLGQFIWKLQM